MTYTPQLFKSLLQYQKKDFLSDLISGIMLGIIAFPMALAFAIASGVRPEQGIYTSIFAGFVIALFGGSKFQVSGPTGAFVVVILSVVHQYGYSGLAIATIMAGVMIAAVGFLRLGSLVKYMPYPVIIGFTRAIALIIFSTQIGSILGINLTAKSDSLIISYKQYFSHINETNFYALALAVFSFLVTVTLPKINKKIPSSLFAIILATLISYFFHFPVETIGTKFGNIPATLPHPELPTLSVSLIQKLLPSAVTIALLGAVESLLSATVADSVTKSRHNSNAELIGQGLGNIISPFFHGIPATGGIVRTAANIRFGGKSPLSSLIHCVVLVLILIVFSRLAAFIPLAALAGILVVVAWNMSEVKAVKKVLQTTRADILVLVATFALTVLTNLTTAIEVGIILSALSLIQKNVKESFFIIRKPNDFNLSVEAKFDSDNIEVLQLKGGLFFGTADKLRDITAEIIKNKKENQIVIFKMIDVYFIDASGIHELEETYGEFKKAHINFYLCNLNPQPERAILHSHIHHTIKKEDIHRDLQSTMLYIKAHA